jgi:hypothetical protein
MYFEEWVMNKLSILIAAVGLVFATTASAAVHTYDFGGAPFNGPGITPSSSFATLTIDDASNLFTLSLGNLVSFGFGPNANATDLAVSYLGTPGSIPTISGVTGGITSINTTNSNQPVGAFDFGFGFDSGGNVLSSGETVSWTSNGFDFSQVTSGQYGSFALRIQGAGQGAQGNAWYGVTPVPEPETYAMMLAGLGLIGFMSRRRKNNQA